MNDQLIRDLSNGDTVKMPIHLRADITWGNIVTTIGIIITILIGWGSLQADLTAISSHMALESHKGSERRLDVVEKEVVTLSIKSTATSNRIESLQREILSRMDKSDAKLDRLIEGRASNK